MNVNQFLESLFGSCLSQNGGFIELRQFKFTPRQVFCQSVDEAIAHLDKFKVDGYFGVCPRKGHDGTKAGVSHVVALWADIDYGKEGHKGKSKHDTRDQALTAIDQFEIKPSIIVSTGHGFQTYWLLHQPEIITDDSKIAKVEGILKGIKNAIGGDSVQDLSHVLRIPETTNQKPGCVAKNVEITKLESDLRYSLDDFAKYQCEAKVDSKSHVEVSFSESIEKVDVDTLDISPKFRDLIKVGDTQGKYPSRSNCDQAVITALVSNGYGPDVIKSIFSDEYNKISEKYLEERAVKGDSYLKTSIKTALNFLQGKPKPEGGCPDSLPALPLEAFPTTGFLGEYIQYASPNTDAPVQFHVATALSVLSTVVNRKLFIRRGHKNIHPVLWIVVLADSGICRKSSSQDIGLDLLDLLPGNLKGSNDFSREGLIKELSVSPKKIYSFTEFSTLLTTLEASYNRGLKPILISLFDSPLKYKRTLKEEGFSIEEPFLNIIAASTDEWTDNVKEVDLKSGFMARFMYICAAKRGKPMPFPPPADLKWQKKLIKMLTKVGKKHGEVQVGPEALKLYETWYYQHQAKLEKESLKGLLAPFYTRLEDYCLKVTMLFAVNDGSLTISEAHMKQGIVLIDYLTNNLRHYLMNELAFSPFAKEKKKIMEMITNAGLKGIIRARLLKNSNMDKVNLDRYLDTLKESDEIYEIQGPKGGRIYVSTQYKSV